MINKLLLFMSLAFLGILIEITLLLILAGLPRYKHSKILRDLGIIGMAIFMAFLLIAAVAFCYDWIIKLIQLIST